MGECFVYTISVSVQNTEEQAYVAQKLEYLGLDRS